VPTVTLADLDARVLHRVEENSQFYQASSRYGAINESVRATNLWTGFYQGRIPLSLSIPNRTIYDLPRNVLVPMSVYFNFKEIRKTSLPEIASAKKDFMARTGATDGRMRMWCPIGLRKIVVYPADYVGGRTMEVGGVLEPDPLVNPTDVVTIPDQYTEAIEEYAWFTLVLTEGGKVFSDAVMAYQKWHRLMMDCSMWTLDKNDRMLVEVSSR